MHICIYGYIYAYFQNQFADPNFTIIPNDNVTKFYNAENNYIQKIDNIEEKGNKINSYTYIYNSIIYEILCIYMYAL